VIQPPNNKTRATRGAEVPQVQPPDTPLTVSRQGFRFHPDGGLEDLGLEDFGSAAPSAGAESEIPEAFRELADTIATLATACFECADAAEAPMIMGPAETVDCDDEDADDGNPGAAGSDPAESSDGTLAAAAAGTTEYGLRIMEATCINTNAMVAFAGALLRAKSLSEMVVLTTAHARRQIETVADQTKQLAAAAHKMAPQKSVAVEAD